MRVHLIKEQTIKDYVAEHAGSRTGFERFLATIRYADWQEPGDIKATFGAADLLGGGSNRVVFDIAGNHYRMICKYLFGAKEAHLYICWIGTHAEYTKLCHLGEQYTATI